MGSRYFSDPQVLQSVYNNDSGARDADRQRFNQDLNDMSQTGQIDGQVFSGVTSSMLKNAPHLSNDFMHDYSNNADAKFGQRGDYGIGGDGK
jgi:hypothetical protein